MDQSLENNDSILDQIDEKENDINNSITLNQSISLIFPENKAQSRSKFEIESDQKLKIIYKFFRKQIEQLFAHYNVQAIYKGDHVLLHSQNQDYDFTTIKNQLNKIFVELVIDPYPTNDQSSVKVLYSSPFVIQGLRQKQIFFLRQQLQNFKQLVTFYYMSEQKDFFKEFKASFRGIRLFFHKNQAIFNRLHPEQIETLEPIVQIQLKYYKKFIYEQIGNLSFINSINILNENEHHASQTIVLNILQYNTLTQDKLVEQLSAYIKLKIDSLFYFKIGYKLYNNQDIENLKKVSEQINNLQKDNKFLATSTYNISKQYLMVIGDDADIVAILDYLLQYLEDLNFSDEFRKFIIINVYPRNLNFNSIKQSDGQVEKTIEQNIKAQDIIHLHQKNNLEWSISLQKSYSMKNYLKVLKMIANTKQKITSTQNQSDLNQIWNYLVSQSEKYQRRQLFDNSQSSPQKRSDSPPLFQQTRQNQQRYKQEQQEEDLNFDNESILKEFKKQDNSKQQSVQYNAQQSVLYQQASESLVQTQEQIQEQIQVQSQAQKQLQAKVFQQVQPQIQTQVQPQVQPQEQPQVQKQVQQQLQEQVQTINPVNNRNINNNDNQVNNYNNYFNAIVERIKLRQIESFLELLPSDNQLNLSEYYVYDLVLTQEFNEHFKLLEDSSEIHLRHDIKTPHLLFSILDCTKDQIYQYFKQINQSTAFTKNLQSLLPIKNTQLIIVSFPSRLADKVQLENQLLEQDLFQLKQQNTVYPKYAICRRIQK